MANKRQRQSLIRAVIEADVIASQEELRVRLQGHALWVTQATLSRDLREMGIVRVPGEDGPRYRLSASLGDPESPSLELLLPQLFERLDGVRELLVLHTKPSGAQPIAEAIDAQGWREVLGTLAGDDTVLVVCRSPDARTQLSDRLEGLAGAEPRVAS